MGEGPRTLDGNKLLSMSIYLQELIPLLLVYNNKASAPDEIATAWFDDFTVRYAAMIVRRFQ